MGEEEKKSRKRQTKKIIIKKKDQMESDVRLRKRQRKMEKHERDQVDYWLVDKK